MNFNFTTKSPKILENISKFILIIADFNKGNRFDEYETVFIRFFQICCVFLGHPVQWKKWSELTLNDA